MSSIYTANQTAVSELYIALLGRNPEQEGYAFWVNKLNNGETQLQAAAQMAYAPEFFSTYGALNTQQAIERIYVNVFERTGDVNGIAYWTARANALISSGTPTVVAYAQTATNMIVAGYTNNSTDTPLIQARVDAASADGTAEPSVTHTLTTSQFVYTGSQANDIYNAPLETLGADAVNTLQSVTSIDGAGGTNTLNAVLTASVTPLALTKIQNVNVNINSAAVAATLNLVNAPDVTAVNSVGTIGELTVTNITSGASISTTDVAVASVFSYVTGNTTAADLTVTGATTAGTDITVNNSGGTVNLTSAGTAANSIELLGTAAITTVNVDGAANLTLIAAAATTVNANNTGDVFTGNLTFTAGVAATVNGGSGNDALTGADSVAANISGNDGNDAITAGGGTAHVDSMSGGAGNDVITFGSRLTANTDTAANNDTINGGTGVDTLASTSALLVAIDNTAANAIQSISGIETITVSDTLTGNLTLSKIQAGIATVNLAGANAVTGARTITFDSAVANAALNLAGVVVTDANTTLAAAGTATTDALTVNNTAAAATNVFNGAQLITTGYETLTLNGGTLVATQVIDTLAINGSDGEAATINLTGANAFTLSDVATDNTGLLTVNASGITLTTGAAVFTYADGTFGTGATQSITGSGGNDLITANNGKAATISGGAGNDTLTGGAAADSIQGGLGNDSMVGAGGNDVLKGNEGNDTITGSSAADFIDGGEGNDTIITGSSLTATSTVDGGAGVNTLVISAAVTSPSVGGRVTNIQTLNTSAASQDLSMFTATTLTTVVDEAASLALTNAASTLTGISLDATATTLLSMERAADTTSNLVTLTATGTVDINDVTLANEETIIIDTNAASFTIGTADGDVFTANDLTTLTANGDNDVIVTNAIVGSTALATISNNLTGTAVFTVNATNSTTGITFTASTSTGTTTLTTGSGADNVTAGSGILVASTGIGADTVTGSALDDTITGGAGADSVTGGEGDDTFVVGATLTDWAVGDYVAGGADGVDVLEFGAAGVITYVNRTVSSVETLALNADAANRVTIVEGTGLVTVTGLDEIDNAFTLNYLTDVFAAEAADAASVNSASEWFYELNGADGELTYFDQVLGEAVLVTLVGVEGGAATSGAAVVGGNIVITLVA